MGYRGGRPSAYQDAINQAAGLTVTLRRFVSASAGVSVAGFGASASYIDTPMTAILINPRRGEYATFGGALMAGDFRLTLPVKANRRDLLVYEGETYQIASDATPSKLNNRWVVTVKAGK